MKFVLLVEGATEKQAAADFLRRWLDPKLKRRVGVKPIEFSGCSELVRKMVTKVRMHLDGPRSADIIAVIALLDLYGPNFYPNDKKSVEERHDWAVEHFEKEVSDNRFRMFFAVHEFEAWLLSQPEIFPAEIQKSFPRSIDRPEQVNFNQPPAKLLGDLYRLRLQKTYKKTTYGRDLFSKLDPAVAAEKCPYLKAMLEEMLRLAQAAGL